MKRVFADSFFYLALLNRKDAAHERTVRFAATESVEIITTTAVLLEVGDAMSAPIRRTVGGKLLANLLTKHRTSIHDLSEDLLARGLQLYRDCTDKGWSLTDCISFVVMSDEGLMEALTGDHHFEQAGFSALLRDDR